MTLSSRAGAWRVGAAALASAWMGVAMAAPGQGKKQDYSLGLTARTTQWAESSSATRPIGKAPIKNFGAVAPGCIYRSAQPNPEGYAWLKQQGFRSIVCLRKEHDDNAEEMKKYGFNYLYLPIPDWGEPTNEQAEQFLKFAADSNNWPLLLHCHAGEGRASIMAALVRYSFDGWRMNVALRESRNFRTMSWPLFGSQKRFLDKWAKTHPAGSLRPGTAVSTPGTGQ